MKIEALIDGLQKFQKNSKNFFPKLTISFSEHYAVKEKWSTQQIPFSDDNGLYFYVSKEDEIWYIGKGEFTNGGGIGNRSCSHLGLFAKGKENLFPFHQWINDVKVSKDIKENLSQGNFEIVTLQIIPAFFCSLIEVVSITLVAQSDKKLPALNKKIG